MSITALLRCSSFQRKTGRRSLTHCDAYGVCASSQEESAAPWSQTPIAKQCGSVTREIRKEDGRDNISAEWGVSCEEEPIVQMADDHWNSLLRSEKRIGNVATRKFDCGGVIVVLVDLLSFWNLFSTERFL